MILGVKFEDIFLRSSDPDDPSPSQSGLPVGFGSNVKQRRAMRWQIHRLAISTNEEWNDRYTIYYIYYIPIQPWFFYVCHCVLHVNCQYRLVFITIIHPIGVTAIAMAPKSTSSTSSNSVANGGENCESSSSSSSTNAPSPGLVPPTSVPVPASQTTGRRCVGSWEGWKCVYVYTI